MFLRPLIFSAASLALLAPAQRAAPSLDEAVRQTRTVEIAPRKEPPSWMDYGRVASGYAFFAAHRPAQPVRDQLRLHAKLLRMGRREKPEPGPA